MSQYFENDMNLKSDIREINYKYNSFSFVFLSDNGVFSKKNIDFGSRLLLSTYLEENNVEKKVLDVGCGYGFLGICIAAINNSNVDMIDVNKRAVHLTNRNIKKNKLTSCIAFESDAYSEVKDKYDCIITNPPIRVGKDKLLEILMNAIKYMNDDGTLYYVMRKDQGALSIQKKLEEIYKIEIINKSKGFMIFKCKKC